MENGEWETVNGKWGMENGDCRKKGNWEWARGRGNGEARGMGEREIETLKCVFDGSSGLAKVGRE